MTARVLISGATIITMDAQGDLGRGERRVTRKPQGDGRSDVPHQMPKAC